MQLGLWGAARAAPVEHKPGEHPIPPPLETPRPAKVPKAPKPRKVEKRRRGRKG
ncbi:MAG: hypothetical protein QOF01_4678 [Thermomicrobiales bacterium]|jgi:hypothetical protein|nr:hypothetical protein [Thermomicrobiales bacterium]MEA2598209.1 hypothetical protein [Thermomicrobiales bacterium]